MEIDEKPSPDFYRQLLHSAKIFLTEVEGGSSRSTSECQSISRCSSASPSLISTTNHSKDIHQQLIFKREQCHQRLLTCSRKKLRLLSLQQQNDKRHYTFQKFVDNLDEKRSASIRRYQLELKDYLLNRLESDRLKQEVHLLNTKIDQLKEKKRSYSHVINIVQNAIPLFPAGLLQSGSDGTKSLILRYQTLVENKHYFEQRDFSQEKQERKQKLQQLILDHNTRIAKLSTRLAQLNYQLNQLQKQESVKEEHFINQIDTKRLNATVLSQLQSCINSLYDRYRLSYQIPKGEEQTTITTAEKLRYIQEFILYRIDLLERANH